MPLTSGLTSRTLALKGKGHAHTERWHRCWEKVQAKGKDRSSAAAICTTSVGYHRSLNPGHKTKGPHFSDKPKGWIPPEKRKSGETSRSRYKDRKMEFVDVLKFGV
jgi:hypothetical protein